MYEILKAWADDPRYLSHTDTTAASPDPGPSDLWLFTDPVAQAIYAQQGQRDRLRADICTYVMYGGQWSPDELQFKREIRRLLCEGLLIPKGTFGYLSPHPTVYQAISEGVLRVDGGKYYFHAGDDVVFEPWLARVSLPGLVGPVRIGRLRTITTFCLCGEAFPKAGELCERAFAILRQTLPHGANGSGLKRR